MGIISGLIKRLLKLSLYVAIFILIIILIPNIPPYVKFTSIELEPTRPRTGPLAINGALNNAQQLYKNKLLGPEAFHLFDKEVYTSLATGEVVKLSPGGHVTFVTKVGEPCIGLLEEKKCGRPLGITIDENEKKLYVADAYHGIWKVDLKTDKKQLLVSPRVEIEGRAPRLFNGIALDKHGDFYWTDSTSDFELQDGANIVLADPSGRLFHYSAAKNQSKVLLDDVWFANGLVISPDRQFLVVSETNKYRLLKYYIDGPKKGTSEVFVAGIPGIPDNVRVLPDGSGLLVGLYVAFDDDHPLLARSLAPTPCVRKFLARLTRLIEIPFEYLNSLYSHVVLQEIVYHIGHIKSLSGTLPPIAGLLQVDWNGNIVASYYNTDGSLKTISDAIVYNDLLLTGAPHGQNFVGAVPVPELLKKAFINKSTASKIETQKVPKEEAKVQKPAPTKPLTTPPKPTEAPTTTPKPTQAPTTTPKPTQAPTTTPKPTEAPTTTPKPTQAPTTTPKPTQAPTTTPKPTQAPTTTPKPTEAPTTTPKPTQAPTTTPKPTQAPTTTPKPTEAPTTTPKPTQAPTTTPKPTQAPTTTPKPAQAPTTTPKPTQAPTPMPKPTQEPTTTPKPPQAPTTPTPVETKKVDTKPVEKKNEIKPEPKQKVEQEKPKSPESKTGPAEKPAKEQIPITEEFPSDTAQPTKETLKVIKKGGPAEIPNPHLV